MKTPVEINLNALATIGFRRMNANERKAFFDTTHPDDLNAMARHFESCGYSCLAGDIWARKVD